MHSLDRSSRKGSPRICCTGIAKHYCIHCKTMSRSCHKSGERDILHSCSQSDCSSRIGIRRRRTMHTASHNRHKTPHRNAGMISVSHTDCTTFSHMHHTRKSFDSQHRNDRRTVRRFRCWHDRFRHRIHTRLLDTKSMSQAVRNWNSCSAHTHHSRTHRHHTRGSTHCCMPRSSAILCISREIRHRKPCTSRILRTHGKQQESTACNLTSPCLRNTALQMCEGTPGTAQVHSRGKRSSCRE